MSWFNVVKGNYPAINMVTLDRLVKADETGIVRGSCIVVDTDTFRRCSADDAATNDLVYWSLNAQTDFTSIQAGTGVEVNPIAARVAGIPCVYPMEVETDQYAEVDGGQQPIVYTVGEFLTCGPDGLVTEWATTNKAIGIVTAIPFDRWISNADQVGTGHTLWRAGNKVSVIRFQTCYLPGLAAVSP